MLSAIREKLDDIIKEEQVPLNKTETNLNVDLRIL